MTVYTDTEGGVRQRVITGWDLNDGAEDKLRFTTSLALRKDGHGSASEDIRVGAPMVSLDSLENILNESVQR